MNSLTKHRTRVSLFTVAVAVILIVPRLPAQDIAAQQNDVKQNDVQPGDKSTQESAKAEKKGSADDSIFGLMLNSGRTGVAFMVVLGLFSMVGVTVAIERAVNTRRGKIIPAEFVGDLQRLVENPDTELDSFRKLSAQWAAPIANVLKAGVLRCGRPLPEIEKSMEDAAAREMATLRGGIKPLSVIGSVAPLVGLLGTVLGMIVAFRTASQAGLGKGELMAQGIYMALLTTAAGLSIAIPALLLAAVFHAKVETFFRQIDEHLVETMPCFARMEQAHHSHKSELE